MTEWWFCIQFPVPGTKDLPEDMPVTSVGVTVPVGASAEEINNLILRAIVDTRYYVGAELAGCQHNRPEEYLND